MFSMCKFFKDSNDGHTANCCQDPVVYQRINEEIRQWIWEKAPGVRDSSGCKKNEIKSILLREQLKKVWKFLQL